MPFQKGNRDWEARSSFGPKPKFATPELLEAACKEYYKWVADNPLQEEKAFAFQGVVTKETISKMRAMTLSGLQDFLDIHPTTWGDWRKKDHVLSSIVAKAERIIRRQKFEGASADMLNSNIIARDLGLSENTKSTETVNVTFNGKDADL